MSFSNKRMENEYAQYPKELKKYVSYKEFVSNLVLDLTFVIEIDINSCGCWKTNSDLHYNRQCKKQKCGKVRTSIRTHSIAPGLYDFISNSRINNKERLKKYLNIMGYNSYFTGNLYWLDYAHNKIFVKYNGDIYAEVGGKMLILVRDGGVPMEKIVDQICDKKPVLNLWMTDINIKYAKCVFF